MITIPTQILKAALLCAGVKDIRNYLNGVHIERAATDEVHVMSTDGEVAFICPLDATQVTECTQVGPWRLTIPYDIVKTAIKT